MVAFQIYELRTLIKQLWIKRTERLLELVKKNPRQLVLIGLDGRIYVKNCPVPIATIDSKRLHLDGWYIVPDDVIVLHDPTFLEFQAWIKKTYPDLEDKLYAACRTSHYVTIKNLVSLLGVKREIIMSLKDKMLTHNVIEQYYSYWKITPAFAEFVKTKERTDKQEAQTKSIQDQLTQEISKKENHV